MKRLLYLLIIGTLIFSFVGCNSNKDNINENNSQNIDENIENDIESQNTSILMKYSERDKNTELEKLIIDTFEIPEEYKNNTRYYYNYVDLNSDGVDEIFAIVIGSYTSGSGGSTALIAEKQNDSFFVRQTLTLINQPIIISDVEHNGMKDIIVPKDDLTSEYVRIEYNNDYGYQSVNDGEVLENLNDVKGIQIISDDLAFDLENQNYLTLE